MCPHYISEHSKTSIHCYGPIKMALFDFFFTFYGSVPPPDVMVSMYYMYWAVRRRYRFTPWHDVEVQNLLSTANK